MKRIVLFILVLAAVVVAPIGRRAAAQGLPLLDMAISPAARTVAPGAAPFWSVVLTNNTTDTAFFQLTGFSDGLPTTPFVSVPAYAPGPFGTRYTLASGQSVTLTNLFQTVVAPNAPNAVYDATADLTYDLYDDNTFSNFLVSDLITSADWRLTVRAAGQNAVPEPGTFALVALCCLGVLLIRLKTVPFSDGTGSIGLAPGWKIDDQKRDSIVISGPDGASLRLGQYSSTIQPASVQYGAERYFTVIQNLSDPVGATAAYVDQASRRAGRPMRLRVLEAKPASKNGGGGGMNAVTLHYRIDGADAQEGYGFFAAGPVGNGMGQLYSSFMVASPGAFKKHFVTMLAIWRSRRTNFAAGAFTEFPAEAALKMQTLEEHSRKVRELL